MPATLAHDAFTDVFGRRRGSIDGSIPLPLDGDEATGHARELLTLLSAGLLSEPLCSLARLGVVALDPELKPRWPPEEVTARALHRGFMSKVSPEETPGDVEAELLFDPADSVRRAVAEHLAAYALAAWFPIFQEVSHTIGLRRRDMADHAVEIDGVIHLYEPANPMLAGNPDYMQTMACKESACQAAQEGRLHFVARGTYAKLAEEENRPRSLALCSGCRKHFALCYDEVKRETSSGWTPLPMAQWGYCESLSTWHIYQQLCSQPDASEDEIRAFALASVRAHYLSFITDLMKSDDKHGLWYRAPELSDEERRHVHHGTSSARAFTDPAQEMLDAQCPEDPWNFKATASWRRAWCERLLAHLDKNASS